MTQKVTIETGDITSYAVDAIVNAANRALRTGGGVAGAIHRAAGPELEAECLTLGGCETGEAKISGGYRLPARQVIHTVGPVWRGGGHGEAGLLADCYRNSLDLAVQNGVRTIAFPALSTGAFGYPLAPAAEIAVSTVCGFLRDNPEAFESVIFVCFDQQATTVFREAVARCC